MCFCLNLTHSLLCLLEKMSEMKDGEDVRIHSCMFVYFFIHPICTNECGMTEYCFIFVLAMNWLQIRYFRYIWFTSVFPHVQNFRLIKEAKHSFIQTWVLWNHFACDSVFIELWYIVESFSVFCWTLLILKSVFHFIESFVWGKSIGNNNRNY